MHFYLIWKWNFMTCKFISKPMFFLVVAKNHGLWKTGYREVWHWSVIEGGVFFFVIVVITRSIGSCRAKIFYIERVALNVAWCDFVHRTGPVYTWALSCGHRWDCEGWWSLKRWKGLSQDESSSGRLPLSNSWRVDVPLYFFPAVNIPE
jgi:hypothetical protein